MAASVIEGKEINLAGTYYKLVGPVEPIPGNVYPEQIITGDKTRASSPNLSSVVFSDFREGMGLDIMEGFEIRRCWDTTLDIRFKRSVTLGPLVVTSSDSGDSLPSTNYGFVDFGQNLYTMLGTDIWTYQANDDTWTDTTRNNSSVGYAMIEWIASNGTTYLVLASDTNGYIYKSSTTVTDAFSTSTGIDARELGIWDDRLWGVDVDGNMWYAFEPGTEVTVNAKLPLAVLAGGAKEGVQRLYSGVAGPSGETSLFIKTLFSLYVYDAGNDRFIKINIPTPRANKSDLNRLGGDAIFWNNRHYLAFGSQLMEYDPINNFTIRDVFWAREDGMDTDRDAPIVRLAASDYQLFAVTNSVSIGSPTIGHIYSYDTRGWQSVHTNTVTAGIQHLFISRESNTGSDHINRLYFNRAATDQDIDYIDLPLDQYNHKRNPAHTYAASGVLKTPWFHADQVDVDKLAVFAKIETSDTSTSGTVENIKIEYAVDYDEGSSDANYKTLANATFTDGLIDTDDTGVTVTTFVFPLETGDITVAPVGKDFKAIRFKISSTRGGTITNSPRFISLTLEYRKKLVHKRSYRMILDLDEEFKTLAPGDQRTNLLASEVAKTLQEFTFRENDSMYVDVYREAGAQESGFNQGGQVAIRVVEA